MKKYSGFALLIFALSWGIVTCQPVRTPTSTMIPALLPFSPIPTTISQATVAVTKSPIELSPTVFQVEADDDFITPTLTPTVFVPSPPIVFTSLLTASKDLQILSGQIPSLPLAARDYPDLASWVQANVDSATLWANYVDGNEVLYRAEMEQWNTSSARTPPANVWLREYDLDNDGEQELIFSFPIFGHYLRDNDPRPFSFYCDGVSGMCFAFAFIFEQQDGIYTPVCWIGDVIDYDETPNNTPQIFALEDVNRDGLVEVMLSEFHCGAMTCFTTLHIVNWNGYECKKLGTFRGEMAEINMVDENDDGIKEFHIYFPQHNMTDIYVLDETQYKLLQSVSE